MLYFVLHSIFNLADEKGSRSSHFITYYNVKYQVKRIHYKHYNFAFFSFFTSSNNSLTFKTSNTFKKRLKAHDVFDPIKEVEFAEGNGKHMFHSLGRRSWS
jgi:hypothetical protein